MERSTFNLLFYIKRCELKKDGRAPIMGRITINGVAKQFSCHLAVHPKRWDTKSYKAIGNSDEAKVINSELRAIRKEITRHYWEIRRGVGPVTAERVKAAFFGMDRTCRTLLQVFAQYNEQLAVMRDNNLRSASSYNKYRTTYNHLTGFLASKYKFKDIALTDLRLRFIVEFELYLRKNKRCSNNTTFTYMMPLKKMIAISRNNGWLDWNPFADHRISLHRTERNYLTTKELGILINATLKKPMLEIVRDLFLFCCFTGVTYSDLANLSKSNVRKGEDGNTWLSYKRQKTGLTCNLRLLDIPLMVIRKYKGKTTDDRLFPMPCYDALKNHIKTIMKVCDIKKHITWHAARHTAATVVFLANNVSMENVAKILGHSNTKMTQHYAKVLDSSIMRDMANVEESLAAMNL